MKKVYSVIILVSLAVLYSCSVLDSSYDPDGFNYELKTEKNSYSVNDEITYSFINTSSQNLYLFARGCTIVDLRKFEQGEWESIPTSYACIGLRPPVEVLSGEESKINFDLNFFDEDELEGGTYRFYLVAGIKSGDEYSNFREINTNNFEIIK